jgi:hypothetical protein
MPTYEITDNQGRTLEFSGDQPPTEDIIAQSFAQAFPNQTTADEILPPARSLREARMKQDAGQGFKYPSYGELGRYALGGWSRWDSLWWLLGGCLFRRGAGR